jgi:hypothetical protein
MGVYVACLGRPTAELINASSRDGLTVEEWDRLLSAAYQLDWIPSALLRAEAEVLTAALGTDMALDLLEREWANARTLNYLDGLRDRDLRAPQKRRVVDLIRSVIGHSETLPSNQRVAADRAVYRLLHRVDGADAVALALECLAHRRTYVRKAAYRFFATRGVPPDQAHALIEHADRFESQEPLQVLARSPEAVTTVDGWLLMSLLDDRYWRMRILEAYLIVGKRIERRLAGGYPIEFVWASARQPSSASLPRLRALFREHRGDPEFVRWYIWALGKVGAARELKRIRPEAEALVARWNKRLPELTHASAGTHAPSAAE